MTIFAILAFFGLIFAISVWKDNNIYGRDPFLDNLQENNRDEKAALHGSPGSEG